jgi:hypothetical protein
MSCVARGLPQVRKAALWHPVSTSFSLSDALTSRSAPGASGLVTGLRNGFADQCRDSVEEAVEAEFEQGVEVE